MSVCEKRSHLDFADWSASITTTDARLHPIAGTVTNDSTPSVGCGGLYHVEVGYGDPRLLLCEACVDLLFGT